MSFMMSIPVSSSEYLHLSSWVDVNPPIKIVGPHARTRNWNVVCEVGSDCVHRATIWVSGTAHIGHDADRSHSAGNELLNLWQFILYRFDEPFGWIIDLLGTAGTFHLIANGFVRGFVF